MDGQELLFPPHQAQNGSVSVIFFPLSLLLTGLWDKQFRMQAGNPLQDPSNKGLADFWLNFKSSIGIFPSDGKI